MLLTRPDFALPWAACAGFLIACGQAPPPPAATPPEPRASSATPAAPRAQSTPEPGAEPASPGPRSPADTQLLIATYRSGLSQWLSAGAAGSPGQAELPTLDPALGRGVSPGPTLQVFYDRLVQDVVEPAMRSAAPPLVPAADRLASAPLAYRHRVLRELVVATAAELRSFCSCLGVEACQAERAPTCARGAAAMRAGEALARGLDLSVLAWSAPLADPDAAPLPLLGVFDLAVEAGLERDRLERAATTLLAEMIERAAPLGDPRPPAAVSPFLHGLTLGLDSFLSSEERGALRGEDRFRGSAGAGTVVHRALHRALLEHLVAEAWQRLPVRGASSVARALRRANALDGATLNPALSDEIDAIIADYDTPCAEASTTSLRYRCAEVRVLTNMAGAFPTRPIEIARFIDQFLRRVEAVGVSRPTILRALNAMISDSLAVTDDAGRE